MWDAFTPAHLMKSRLETLDTDSKSAHEHVLCAQWLIFNDCVFRTRNVYEFIMFHDRDEFVHFVGTDKPREVNLTSFFRKEFGSDQVASVTYWGGLYRIHCHVSRVRCHLWASCH